MKIQRIEVQFSIPVEMTNEEQQKLVQFIGNITRRSETPNIVHWPAGIGSKPLWREPQEPNWDDLVFFIDCCARERYENEPFKPVATVTEKYGHE